MTFQPPSLLGRGPRLPEGWSELEVVQDTIEPDGLRLHRAGVASVGPTGEEVTGSAVETDSSPIDRAFFELLERISTVEALHGSTNPLPRRCRTGSPLGTARLVDVLPESDAPDRWRYARSNGVALQVSWERAAEAAFLELVERDRVLRAWYGETRPKAVVVDWEATPLAATSRFDWRAVSFPESTESSLGRGVVVVGIFGFPLVDDTPFVFGYGARGVESHACMVAIREALQSLAFLWGEPAPTTSEITAPTAMSHLDAYQTVRRQRDVRAWLDGAHSVFGEGRERRTASSEVSFIDLTPRWLKGEFCVAKAVCAAAEPLAFGVAPFAGHLPLALRSHPIC